MGLMTGTSMDGLDLAVVDIVIKNGYPVPSNVISHTIPFPGKLKKQISLAVSGNKSLYKSLDDTLGRWIADRSGPQKLDRSLSYKFCVNK